MADSVLTKEVKLGGRSIPVFVFVAGGVIAGGLVLVPRLLGKSATSTAGGGAQAAPGLVSEQTSQQIAALQKTFEERMAMGASALAILSTAQEQLKGNLAAEGQARQAALAQVSGQVSGLESAITALGKQAESLQSGTAQTQKQMSDLKAQVSQLSARVSTIETQGAKLTQGNLTTLYRFARMASQQMEQVRMQAGGQPLQTEYSPDAGLTWGNITFKFN